MAECGLPKTLMAGHSIRRGGCCLWHATGKISDSYLKSWGRWESDAFLDYVFCFQDQMTEALTAYESSGINIQFELKVCFALFRTQN